MELPRGTIVYRVGVHNPSLHIMYKGTVLGPAPEGSNRYKVTWLEPKSSIMCGVTMTVWHGSIAKTPKQAINKYLRSVREDLEEQVNKHGWK